MPNCKVGDLAVMRGPKAAPFEGYIVRCVRWLGVVPGGVRDDFWLIDRKLSEFHTGTVSDYILIPIRGDSTDTDEMIHIAGPAPRESVEA